MATSGRRIQEIMDYCKDFGDIETCKKYNLNIETLQRYKRSTRQNTLIDKILKIYTPKELEIIANGGRLVPGMAKVPVIDFTGDTIKSGHLTDTHIGSLFSNDDDIYKAFEEFEKEKVEFVTISGDITEGFSNRPGHVYELSHIGYEAQKSHAIKILSTNKKPTYLISGNHDRWYLKSNGANIVSDIALSLENYHFLGHDEGDISLNGKAVMRLWHGEDSSSYAISYRPQKLIESLSGGEKPNILMLGHVHKHGYFFIRNVHCFSIGCIQRQTRWMRSKRIDAHPGFYILETTVNTSGVAKIKSTWYPFYS